MVGLPPAPAVILAIAQLLAGASAGRSPSALTWLRSGRGDWRNVLKDGWANYRDEAFIQQYLGPEVIRRFRMFAIEDEAEAPQYLVSGIHNERGFRHVRDVLAKNHDTASSDPDIQVVDVDLLGDRKLNLQHVRRDGIPLEDKDRDATIAHLERLWGYEVELEEVPGAE